MLIECNRISGMILLAKEAGDDYLVAEMNNIASVNHRRYQWELRMGELLQYLQIYWPEIKKRIEYDLGVPDADVVAEPSNNHVG
jgi:hypothetical protein